MRVRKRYWETRATAIQERLQEVIWWYPFPLFISFGLVMVLTSHILFSSNPRAGNPADLVAFAGEHQKDSSLWMSISPLGKDIVVTTGDRKVFRWRQDARNLDDIGPLVDYLRKRSIQEIRSAVVAGQIRKAQIQAVIAADQRLKFLHVRPLIYALAQAGISQYAFETLNPRVAVNDATHHDDSHGANSGSHESGSHANDKHGGAHGG